MKTERNRQHYLQILKLYDIVSAKRLLTEIKLNNNRLTTKVSKFFHNSTIGMRYYLKQAFHCFQQTRQHDGSDEIYSNKNEYNCKWISNAYDDCNEQY